MLTHAVLASFPEVFGMSKYSNLSKEITAGVLSAMLSFGSHATGSYAGNRAAVKYEQSESSARHTSNYGNQLNSWLDQVGYGSNNKMKGLFNSNMSDDSKYMCALAFYDEMTGKSTPQKHESEMMHLEPYEEADGSFGYRDRRKGHIVAMANKLPNGLFTYYGPKEFTSLMFGRGELSTLVDKTAKSKNF